MPWTDDNDDPIEVRMMVEAMLGISVDDSRVAKTDAERETWQRIKDECDQIVADGNTPVIRNDPELT